MTLADRVEQASGPDRELDARIKCFSAGGDFDTCVAVVPNFKDWYMLPHYTASLDAAMTLMPEGCDWTLSVEAYAPCLVTIPSGDDRVDAVHGHAATPALALLAAILRAHEQGGEGDD